MTLGSRLSGSAWPQWALLCRSRPAPAPTTFAISNPSPPRPNPLLVGSLPLRRSSSSSDFPKHFSDQLAPQRDRYASWTAARASSASKAAAARQKEAAALRRPAEPSFVDRLERVPVRPHIFWDPVVVQNPIALPDPVEQRKENRHHHHALKRQQRIELRRQAAEPPDWRLILEELMVATRPQDVPNEVVKVELIEEGAVERLKGDFRKNLWNIKSHSGCDIRLYMPKDGAGEESRPYLLLTGEPWAVSQAVDDIVKVAKDVQVTRFNSTSDIEDLLPSPDEEPTWIVPPEPAPIRRQYTLYTRADEHPLPERWTFQTFYQYIATLTQSYIPPYLERTLYPHRTETHQECVVRLLHSVFADPVVSRAATLPALKLALKYFARGGERFVSDAQKLVERAKALGLPIDVEVYNLLLQETVKAKNIVAFRPLVHKMLAAGHTPNIRTWCHFLRLVEAEEVRRYILQAMHTKNFFSKGNRQAVILVSNELAHNDAYRAVQLGQDAETFLREQARLYGEEWRLTRAAANRVLYVFGSYGKWDDCRRILEHMFASERDRPNVKTLNVLLTHCKCHRRLDEALRILAMFDAQGMTHIVDETSCYLLFELARVTHKAQVLTTVWRYVHYLADMPAHSNLKTRGIKLLQGGEEVEKVTKRVKKLWNETDGSSIARDQWLRRLMLCDFGRWYQKKYGRSVEEVLKGFVESEAMSAAGSQVEHTTQPPDSPSSSDPVRPDHLSLKQITHHSPGKALYGAFTSWAVELIHHSEPAVPLSTLLCQAYEKDLLIHSLVWEGPPEGCTDVEGLVKRGLEPVEIPLRKRGC
ncbi:uncharacterized protein CTHT_0051030 [Thermochaetoides thermophila DSM 1495]|uniref:Pentatricopeptide repeat domain-containing protein n=1 Tax=Chaetomium thermophilum (strain DSM 1495 / CBS 144.50 / IMI 039719) TaxID=759272 RepID=G0SDA0_CHATD|nr:hypothetical protein CTHT_0051030 [Thermochaetoides thermophila DSM 1495]EGS18501.1 hypothetical protein CTHT_0051030 [Thermochaetoides thermophila DSM 1495]